MTRFLLQMSLASLFMIAILALSACTSSEPVSETVEGELHIMLVDAMDIRASYTDLFQAINPELEIVITDLFDVRNTWLERDDWDEKMSTLSAGPYPDIIVSSGTSFLRLIQEGLLTSLEPIWEQTKLEEERLTPVVLDQLRNMGKGELYGLSPSFTGQALAYNKDLFKAAGVPEPTDGMTWDEVLLLAQRIAETDQEDEVRGIIFNDLGTSRVPLYEYFDLHNLPIVSTAGSEMIVNTDMWNEQWRKLAELSDQGALQRPISMYENVDLSSLPSFTKGTIAMSVVSSNQLSSLILNIRETLPLDERFEWNVVTMPVVASAPDTGGSLGLGSIFSIHAHAENVDNAYKFLEFVHSEAWARLQTEGGLLTYESYNAPISGLDYDPSVFYQLKPQDLSHQAEVDLTEIKTIGYDLFMEVLRNEKSVDDALLEWESEGNLLLQ